MKEQTRNLEFNQLVICSWVGISVTRFCCDHYAGWAENSDSAASSFVQHWEQRQLNTQMFFSHAETRSNISLAACILSA